MTKLLLTLSVGLFLSPMAFADKAEFTFSRLVGFLKTAEGYSRITVSSAEDGKIQIIGRDITNIVAEPVVIKDQRPADGPLYLQVGAAELIVGSGFTFDGGVSYALKLDGQTVSLEPVVYFRLTKTDSNNPQGYICRTDWINCMPVLTPEAAKFCTREYYDWAVKNCGEAPKIAH